ncbi:GMC family oxidoreductase N-terminal domain-containing protein [Bradyrhizobium sp. Ash2021]|uniref:GMC family oxidoreductase N-terminal domain-containing protein n=1 Tax=Bradyrhizobium sp. Ash2021 TaxID=2954771 RepID=UPI002814E078|nr:GMC family oxidoreductase N-terminal domain-containing protein [Bradyrhizobium sp. Ash2021]WMT76900.1 GMC family oxidoreductase N-terminal domain-containing protein [Bradyrhizobium sp. Ash2021]
MLRRKLLAGLGGAAISGVTASAVGRATGESQIGVSPVQSTVGNQRRCSAVDAYLRPHLASGRVTLLTGKTVVRILVENKRAVGVELVTPEDMLAEPKGDNMALTQRMRQTHNVCDEHGGVPTASLIENWIDEAERRTWFPFEATRRA